MYNLVGNQVIKLTHITVRFQQTHPSTMTYYDHLFRQLKTIYPPMISPLLIGLNMYTILEEKRYTHIPVVVALPVAYTGYHIGKYFYKIGSFEDDLRNEIHKMFKPE